VCLAWIPCLGMCDEVSTKGAFSRSCPPKKIKKKSKKNPEMKTHFARQN
jgi:hypothetical protein